MEILESQHRPIDLTTDPLHLGLGARARPIAGFSFDPSALRAYAEAVAGDGAEARLVVVIDEDGPGDHWEQHPGGDEVVVCMEGRITVVWESGGRTDGVLLEPGQAVVSPAGVWHVVDAEGAARILTITPGLGTEHRPR